MCDDLKLAGMQWRAERAEAARKHWMENWQRAQKRAERAAEAEVERWQKHYKEMHEAKMQAASEAADALAEAIAVNDDLINTEEAWKSERALADELAQSLIDTPWDPWRTRQDSNL